MPKFVNSLTSSIGKDLVEKVLYTDDNLDEIFKDYENQITKLKIVFDKLASNVFPAISFEGVDCCGKETQSKKLLRFLDRLGYDVKLFDFPSYKADSPGSRIYQEYLKGNFKNRDDITEEIENDIYRTSIAFDMLKYYNVEINEFLKAPATKKGAKKLIIIDRWLESTLAFDWTKKIINNPELNTHDNFVKNCNEIIELQEKFYGLPKSPLVIHCKLDDSIRLPLIAEKRKKSGVKDVHEEDSELMIKTDISYNMYYKEFKLKSVNINKGVPNIHRTYVMFTNETFKPDDVFANIVSQFHDTVRPNMDDGEVLAFITLYGRPKYYEKLREDYMNDKIDIEFDNPFFY